MTSSARALAAGASCLMALASLGTGCTSDQHGRARAAAASGTGRQTEDTSAQAAPAAEPNPCTAAATAVKEPYRWYPALDLARVPFHVASGEWGARAPIVAPEPPAIRRQVTVHSAKELSEAAKVPGTAITVGTSIDETVTLLGDVNDIDLIIPKGKHLRQLVVGRYTPPSKTQRMRVRGSTPMQHSGGLVGALSFLSNEPEDVIIDGVDLNGDNGRGGGGLYNLRGGNRIAIINVRGHAAAFGGLQHHVRNFVMAGSHLVTGQRSRAKNGIPEAWDVRGGDHVVFFRNRMEGTRFHRIRVHPDDVVQYAWIAENTFIDPYEARIVTAMTVGSTKPGTMFDALWAQCNDVYAYSTCMAPSMDAPMATFSRITHNAFHGSITLKQRKELQSHAGRRHDYLTGNTYEAWKSPPASALLGDPRDIPLPADDPTDDVTDSNDPDCPGPQGS